MPRSRSRKANARRTPRVHPRGVLELCRQGYGFVQTSEGEFYVPESKTGGAFDGDMVEVCRLSPDSRRGRAAGRGSAQRPAARVVRVVSRAHEDVVGRYEIAGPFGVVVPEDPRIRHDIFTVRADAPQVRDGDIVRVRMTAYPTRREPAQGVVEEVLGRAGDAGIDIELVIARHKLETRFSPEAEEQAARIADDASRVLAQPGRRDLTGRVAFTIDPDDAKDFDDALSIERIDEDVVRIGVHIADVSHYVPWGSPIDLAARRRSTSVYLVDRVLPMLPEALSNDVCSLRPGVARLTMTVDIDVDSRGTVRRFEAYPSAIESRARLTYGQAQEALEAMRAGDRLRATAALGAAARDAGGIAERIALLDDAARALHAARLARGGMDFESVEAKVRLDGSGSPVGVDLRVRTDATSLVEEAMIAANEAVARFLRDAKTACIYRVHENPATADMAALKPILQEFGYDRHVSLAAFSAADPRAIQRVLEHARGRREEFLVSSLIVRSMKRAVYRDSCERHFGLASDAYAHFTSPIRRYPDLMAHRMLKTALFGRSRDTSAQEHALPALCEHASAAERTAEEAARESHEIKLYELLARDVGEQAWGIVSGVGASGFFVRLATTAEGFVSLAGRDEYFALDPVRRLLAGSDSNTVYRLGMRVRVRIAAVYPYERRADFTLVGGA